MSDALAFYKEVYGEVPGWVQAMHKLRPDALDAYTALRRVIMEEGDLSRKEKEWLLVGVNAARRYERSMMYHTKGALDAGSTVAELAEILVPCILSRGIPAWLEGYKALVYAERYLDKSNRRACVEAVGPSIPTVEEALTYYREEADGHEPDWVQLMQAYSPETLRDYANLRKVALSDGHVPRKMKELVLVGINLAERYPGGVSLHASTARELGATDAELVDVALVCLLTAGIPAWFEITDVLSPTSEVREL